MPRFLSALAETEIRLILQVFKGSLGAQYLKMLCCLQGEMGPVGIIGLLGPLGIKVNLFFLELMLVILAILLVIYEVRKR